jgi:Protein of unknown function (DUF3592)
MAAVGKVRVHCYGCPAVLSVDARLPDQGLKVARWSASGGETFCPSCARQRSLEDPWGSQVPWAEHDHRRRDTGDAITAARDILPAGPAIEDPRTRSSLKRYGRRGWYWLLAGGATLLATFAFLGVRSREAKELLRTGRHTPGLVESYEPTREDKRITVRYVANGEPHEGTIEVKDGYEPGEPVEVIYDPSDPSRIRTPQDANESPLTTRVVAYGVIFGFGMLLSGMIVLMRPRRWRRLLRSPWQAYTVSYAPPRRRRSGPGVRLSPLDVPGAQESVLRLGGAVRGRAAKLAGEPVLWAAGDLNAHVVLAIPGTCELFAAERPRGYFGRRWLAAQRGTTKRERRALRLYLVLIGGASVTVAVLAASRHEWLSALLSGANGAFFLWVFVRSLGRSQELGSAGGPVHPS